VVTAGWQDREGEDRELADHVRRPTVNLQLYRRAEKLFEEDAELAAAHRAKQDTLRRTQRLYRMRLAHALEAVRELVAKREDEQDPVLERAVDEAMEAVRTLDAAHAAALRRVNEAYEQEWRPWERGSVAAVREELARLVGPCTALAIAGGHVHILLNRLRLFGVLELAADRPVVAWSAGAMTLTERIILFHDDPPQGRGNSTVGENGLGLCRGVVALPHARRRLALDKPVRVALFARRYAPAVCLALDEGARADWNGRPPEGSSDWKPASGTRRLTADGKVEPFEPVERSVRLPEEASA
jgi:hypothetical protein